MKSEGLLKTQLFNLDRNATTLERIIYADLTALHSLPDSRAEDYEPRVLRKLEKLDEIQDEIDTVIAELKAAGWYESRTAGRNIYEYKPPTTAKDVSKPKKRGRPPKAGTPRKSPVSVKPKAGKPPKIIQKRGDHATRLIRSNYWIKATELISQNGGQFTLQQLMDATGQSYRAATDRTQTWRQAGLLTKEGKGLHAIYQKKMRSVLNKV